MVEHVWRRWASQRGYDATPFLRVAHGRRISETLRDVAPQLDWRRESAVLDRMEETATDGLVSFPGTADLLGKLPPSTWAIVTSGSRAVARLRLTVSGLSIPSVCITGEDVEQGKPDPEGYRLAAARLDLHPADCVVVEDAPPGIAAAKAAGMRVIAVETTQPPERLRQADAQIGSLSALQVEPGNDRLRLSWVL